MLHNVTQVILCTKEANEKVRRLSFKLLVSMGYAAQRCFRKSAEGTFSKITYKYWSCDLQRECLSNTSCTVFSTSKMRSVNKLLFSLSNFLPSLDLSPPSLLSSTLLLSCLLPPSPPLSSTPFLNSFLASSSLSFLYHRVSDRLLSDGSSWTGRLLSHDLCHYPRPCSTCIRVLW